VRRRRALATETTVEVTFSGLRRTMRNNPVLAERFRPTWRPTGSPTRATTRIAGSTDMANVSWVCPSIHPDLAIAPEGTPVTRSCSATRRRRRRPTRPRLLAATLVAQTAVDLFLEPGLVEAAWRAFREADAETDRPGDPAGTVGGSPSAGCVATIAAARPAGRSASNRRRPERDGPTPRVTTLRPSPEDLRG
jgi:hypothetical protein